LVEDKEVEYKVVVVEGKEVEYKEVVLHYYVNPLLLHLKMMDNNENFQVLIHKTSNDNDNDDDDDDASGFNVILLFLFGLLLFLFSFIGTVL